MIQTSVTNTLRYNPDLCINCDLCSIVCPHGVFAPGREAAELRNPEACMECGACQRNCPAGAISVDSGVGCAAAMLWAALRGEKERESSDCACACGRGSSEPPSGSEGKTAGR